MGNIPDWKKKQNKNDHQPNQIKKSRLKESENESLKKNPNSNIHTMEHMSMLSLNVFIFSFLFFGLFGVSILCCCFASFQFLSFFFLLLLSFCSRSSATSHNAKHIQVYNTHLLTTMITMITKRANRKWINVYSMEESAKEKKERSSQRMQTQWNTYTHTNTSKVKNEHRNKRLW